MDRGAWQAKVHGVQTVGHDLATEQSQDLCALVAQTVKSLPAVWETRVQSLGWEDPLEK